MNIRMHSMWKRFFFLCLTTACVFALQCTGRFGYGAAAQYVKKVSRKRKSKLTQTPITASLSSSLISPNALSAPSPDGSIPPPPYDLSRHCQAPSPRAADPRSSAVKFDLDGRKSSLSGSRWHYLPQSWSWEKLSRILRPAAAAGQLLPLAACPTPRPPRSAVALLTLLLVAWWPHLPGRPSHLHPATALPPSSCRSSCSNEATKQSTTGEFPYSDMVDS